MLSVKLSVVSVLITQASEILTLQATEARGNEAWSKETPAAELKLRIDNPDAQNQFIPGDVCLVSVAREGEGQAVAVPMPTAEQPIAPPQAPTDLDKRLDGITAALNVLQTAGEKLRSYYDTGRIGVPNGADVNDFINMTNAIGSHVAEIRNSLIQMREVLNDAGLV